MPHSSEREERDSRKRERMKTERIQLSRYLGLGPHV